MKIEDSLLKEREKPYPAKKKYKCKKLKGDHVFGDPVPIKSYIVNKVLWHERYCKGCGKKKYIFKSLF